MTISTIMVAASHEKVSKVLSRSHTKKRTFQIFFYSRCHTNRRKEALCLLLVWQILGTFSRHVARIMLFLLQFWQHVWFKRLTCLREHEEWFYSADHSYNVLAYQYYKTQLQLIARGQGRLYIVTCQAHPALVKKANQMCGSFLLIFFYLVHLWTDQRIPGPVSCRCPSGSLETPPRWHATIYYLQYRNLLNKGSAGSNSKIKSELRFWAFQWWFWIEIGQSEHILQLF